MSTAPQVREPIRFAAVGLDHSHAFGQIDGPARPGLPARRAQFRRPRRGRRPDRSEPLAGRALDRRPGELLQDPSIDLIVTAAVPDRRGPPSRSRRCATARTSWPTSRAASPSTSSTRSSRRSPSRVGSGRSPSPSASRCAAPSRPASWSGPDGSGGSSRPWVSDPHREGDRAHLAGGAGRPDWFYDRRPDRRHPHRHRQPPDRPVPVVHRLRRPPRSSPARSPTTPIPDSPAHAGLRRGDAAVRRRPRLRPGRLVHPAGSADLGRRPAGHPGHRGLPRAAQVRRHRRSARVGTTCSSSTAPAPSTSTAPTSSSATTPTWCTT